MPSGQHITHATLPGMPENPPGRPDPGMPGVSIAIPGAPSEPPPITAPPVRDWDSGSARQNVRPVFGGGAKGVIGSIAYIGDSILRGAMKGRQEAQQAQFAKADRLMKGFQYTYQSASQQYLEGIQAGKDPNSREMLEIASAADSAHAAMTQMYGNYLGQGQKKGKKKSGGGGAGWGAGAGAGEENPIVLMQSQDPQDKLRAWLMIQQKVGPAYKHQAAVMQAERQQKSRDPHKMYDELVAQQMGLSAKGDTEGAAKLQPQIDQAQKNLGTYHEPDAHTPKPWTPIYSKVDNRIQGMMNPATGLPVLDPAKMPPDVKGMYDAFKTDEDKRAKEQADKDAKKEASQEAKENRQLQRTITAQNAAFDHALAKTDYAAATKVVTEAKKDYDAAIDRSTTMDKNLASGLKGDQQAMLSLVANHIGMTLGAQKGARITRAVWDEATASAPWLQKIGAKFDERGYLSGVTLAPDQMHQMVNLAHEKVEILKEHVGRVEQRYADELSVGGKRKDKGGKGGKEGGKFTAPKGAPSAKGVPDGHELKANGKVIAVAEGGEWAAPPSK